MTIHQAVTRWSTRQAQLLHATYRKGWQTGQRNYQKHKRAPQPKPAPAAATTTAGIPPVYRAAAPAAATMAAILAPALTSLAAMTAAMATLTTLDALQAFLRRNAWRVALGVYVLWAAEQAGYAEAAARAGELLEWQLDPGADHCSDCPELAQLPPMPLQDWPTLPGEGATECRQGCKCSMHAVAVPVGPRRRLTPEQEEILARMQVRRPELVAA